MKTQGKERGAVLVITLVMLVVTLMLGLSSFQSARLEESMAGNQRALVLSQMAAESGTSKFYAWLKKEIDWPSDLSSVAWKDGDAGVVGEYSGYEVYRICWGPPDESVCNSISAEFVTVTMHGLVDNGDGIFSKIVSKYKRMPSPPKSAAFTCFGSSCSDKVGGSAVLTGKDYHLPDVFDCSGKGCDSSVNESGEEQDDAYYPGVPLGEHPSEEECTESYHEYSEGEPYTGCNGSYYGVNDSYGAKPYWEDFLAYIEAFGFDKSIIGGDEYKNDIGDRGRYDPNATESELTESGFWDTVSPKFIEILPDPDNPGAVVKVSANANTIGVVVIRPGATLEYKGTSTHEGLVIVEPGGRLTVSSGNTKIYGGVVALENLDGETAELNISGNMDVRYSSIAWKALAQGGKGVRLVAWYEDVSQDDGT